MQYLDRQPQLKQRIGLIKWPNVISKFVSNSFTDKVSQKRKLRGIGGALEKDQIESTRRALRKQEQERRELQLVQQTKIFHEQLQNLLTIKNYNELKRVLGSIPAEDVSPKMLTGTIPMGCWQSLAVEAQELADSHDFLQQKQTELSAQLNAIDQQIRQLEASKNLLLEEQHQVVSQLEQSNQLSHLTETLQPLAECEQKLLDTFYHRYSNPGWELSKMTMSDFCVALQIFEIPHMIPPLAKTGFASVQSILAWNLDSLEAFIFPLEDKLKLLYATSMIKKGLFDVRAHNESCNICSCKDAKQFLSLYGISDYLFSQIPANVRALEVRYMMFCNAQNLGSADTASRARIAQALKLVHQSHFGVF